MEIEILETSAQKQVCASIQKAVFKDMPTKKAGWQFTWRRLFKTEGAAFYKLCLEDEAKEVQGILMLSLMFGEMMYMNNIEVAPLNYGSNGKYANIAGALIAYGCLKSFELGQNDYRGYLTFESKTSLISLYEKKYGATHIAGNRMFIAPESGLALINEYLKL